MRSRIDRERERERGKTCSRAARECFELGRLKERRRLGRKYKRLQSGELAQGQECRAQCRPITIIGAT